MRFILLERMSSDASTMDSQTISDLAPLSDVSDSKSSSNASTSASPELAPYVSWRDNHRAYLYQMIENSRCFVATRAARVYVNVLRHFEQGNDCKQLLDSQAAELAASSSSSSSTSTASASSVDASASTNATQAAEHKSAPVPASNKILKAPILPSLAPIVDKPAVLKELASLATRWKAEWRSSTEFKTLRRELRMCHILLRELGKGNVAMDAEADEEAEAKQNEIVEWIEAGGHDPMSPGPISPPSSTSTTTTTTTTTTAAATAAASASAGTRRRRAPEVWQWEAVTDDLEEDELKVLAAEERYKQLPERGWTESSRSGASITYYRKEEGSPLHAFKVSGIVNCSIHDIFPVIYEADLYSSWFPLMNTSAELKSVSRFHKIVQCGLKCPWPFNDRLLNLDATGVDDTERGRILINIKSVATSPYVEIPPTPKNIVLAEMHQAGYLIEILNEKQTRFSFFCNVDVKLDKIPTIILNTATKQLIQMIVGAVETSAKSVHNPKKPWVERMEQKKETYAEIRELLDSSLRNSEDNNNNNATTTAKTAE